MNNNEAKEFVLNYLDSKISELKTMVKSLERQEEEVAIEIYKIAVSQVIENLNGYSINSGDYKRRTKELQANILEAEGKIRTLEIVRKGEEEMEVLTKRICKGGKEILEEVIEKILAIPLPF